ncbi:phage tail protein I [Thalassospira sp.]|uniref:phage tail protein I n=1 Tax=Thalassospira sp. TaxID=1912094 RepID=UPI00262CEF35|nr:phage tail protein I [Thalassospira sp.]MCH2276983.1 phage tail protein I [Thalassospira sp.]
MTSLLPPNATAAERAIEATDSHIDTLDVLIDTVWDPATCPPAFLPWLAWSFSVDTWDPEWPVAVKRQVIAESFDVHRRKGTRGAIRRALEAMDLDLIRIIEWFEDEPQQDPYTFRIEVGTVSRGLTENERKQILATIEATKNVRSHMNDLRIYLQQMSKAPILAAALTTGEITTIYPYAITDRTVQTAKPFLAAGIYGAEIATVYPQGNPA